MELTARVAGRDTRISVASRSAVLSSWYDDYGTLILRTCYLYLGSRSDAEDALQETLLKAWRHIDQFEARNSCSAKTWLMRIAVNTCRDMLRTPWSRRIDHAVDMNTLPEMQASPDGDWELLMDVMALPVKYKEVILLYYYHGMTNKEIAYTLRSSEASVCRRRLKACQMLKQQIGSDDT